MREEVKVPSDKMIDLSKKLMSLFMLDLGAGTVWIVVFL